ncbi:MAG: phenylalanine--tRNA ligase subunit beta [bacterium]|jgi:phenylalanyl-tRNA synthetase beta chain|nr:phenylalanine--tRNA ligase subunit beta [bacterium]
MKIPYSWLAELVEQIPSPAQLAEILTMLGFEVEEIASPGEAIKDVVIGKILQKDPHPDADKLSFCQVTDGETTYPIVCGASNMVAGDHVALARLGTVLPGDFKIEKRKIRGVESQGMMCSTRELGLDDEHGGIMILDRNTPLGKPLVDVLGLNDVIFDLNVTPNRPDALCAIGIAREIAAYCKTQLKRPDASPLPADCAPEFSPSVTLQAEDLCPRYTALRINSVQISPSPDWLKNRLEACGVRSVNNVVDATNLVLLETGQPLHAFDYNKLEENRIVVRQAQPGEHIVCIDGDDRQLSEEMLVIADAAVPVAAAGVMGGLESEVDNATIDILLESAYFSPPSIRRTSKKLQLSSDASYRFERGVDLEGVIPAAWRCARLIRELAGGKIAGQMTVADTTKPEMLDVLRGRTIGLSLDYAARLLGKKIEPDHIAGILIGLSFKVESQDTESIQVRVPSFRNDVRRPADLVEEIARCTGYGEFAPTLPKAPVKAPEPMEVDRKFITQLRQFLISSGLDEAVTYSFIDKEALTLFPTGGADLEHDTVTIQNAIVSNEATMRTSVLASLMVAARRNFAHGNQDFGLFEIARSYAVLDGAKTETKVLAGLIMGNPHSGWRNTRKEQDFFELKGMIETILQIGGYRGYRSTDPPACLHPKRGCQIQAGKDCVGYYGELNPPLVEHYDLKGRILVFELDLKVLSDQFRASSVQYKPFSTFPAMKRDMALLIPKDVAVDHIEKIIRRESGNLLEEVVLFDYYSGKQVQPGYVSGAFRLTFRSPEGTLKEEVVDQAFANVLSQLQKKLQVQLRS